MSRNDDSELEANWNLVAPDFGALTWAWRRAFARLNDAYGGIRSVEFWEAAEQLASDVNVIRCAMKGESIEGLTLKPLPSEPSMYVIVGNHRFVFSKENDSVEYYIPSMILERK